MKQTTLLFKSLAIIAMMTWTTTSHAQTYVENYGQIYYNQPYGYPQMGHPGARNGYYKTQFHVYFGNREIDAIPSNFVVLGGGYAKDAVSVFYFGSKLGGCSPSSFQVLQGGYAKDRSGVYYCGYRVEGAYPSSFRYSGNGYGEDAYHVFYMGQMLR
jgi:hypothetical protein